MLVMFRAFLLGVPWALCLSLAGLQTVLGTQPTGKAIPGATLPQVIYTLILE